MLSRMSEIVAISLNVSPAAAFAAPPTVSLTQPNGSLQPHDI